MKHRTIGGVVGGLVGGVVFGIMRQIMGMLGMVAGVVGVDGAGAGWIVHVVIAVLVGVGYGVVSRLVAPKLLANSLLGLAYGLVWWILGPLLIMPVMIGMPVLMVDGATLISLVGHLVYGVVTGGVTVLVVQRLDTSVSPLTKQSV